MPARVISPVFGSNWEYRGLPCEVKGVIIHDIDGKQEVVGLLVNTGVGPDIEAMLEELTYEVIKS